MRPVLFLSQNMQESNNVFFLWLVRNVLLLTGMGKSLFLDVSWRAIKKTIQKSDSFLYLKIQRKDLSKSICFLPRKK
ncbi:hypothetical protein KCQ_14865 [Pectobacterium atrosepticum ICMP 1526]|nr:hypothetical protein EV46_06410 [Pectobacterium atrosepticum]KFX16976.1 hypothetical protein JV34_03685 [Pectobacterium atrosepticum]KMK80792.1 hypothetical protein KCQ_14865 [Pectobacterium atrosepticum ICMP 1526]PWD60580.1 hypothetical protein DF214_10245 [Pectobacterium atrosepticum]